MGQGYIAVILASKPDQGSSEVIRTWVHPHNYNNGYKLTEHAYVGNEFVQAVEHLICPTGMFYKSRITWAGDYADNEQELDENLYHLAENEQNMDKCSRQHSCLTNVYRYVVNHSTKQYAVKEDGSYSFHPLPLLTAEGNGRGGGDYNETNKELIGTWARDVISVEKGPPAGFKEFITNFTE